MDPQRCHLAYNASEMQSLIEETVAALRGKGFREADARDAVQDAWLAILRSTRDRGAKPTRENLGGLLFVKSRYLLLSMLRTKHRRERILHGSSHQIAARSPAESSDIEIALRDLLMRDESGDVLVAYEILSGTSSFEVLAARMDVSTRTVRRRFLAGLEMLRSELDSK